MGSQEAQTTKRKGKARGLERWGRNAIEGLGERDSWVDTKGSVSLFLSLVHILEREI